LDDVLKRLDDQKAEVQRNIAILDELLGGGTKPQASATRRQPSRVSTATEEPRPSTPGGTFDELAFLSSVIGADGKPIEEQPMPPATAARPPYGAEIPATDLPHVGQPDPEPERSVMSGVRGSAAEI